MGTTLYHWTSRDAMKLILASKKLELEGTEYMAGLREGYSIADQRALDDQYNYCGRFVWFTESPSYNFSGKVKNEMALILDSDAIEVQKWHYVKKENKNNSDFMKIANENDRLAIRMEDDPYQWWVSKQPIELEGLNYQVAMSNWLREMLENEPEGATNSKGVCPSIIVLSITYISVGLRRNYTNSRPSFWLRNHLNH